MTYIRDAQIKDCEDIGLITVSASHSAFIGAIPEHLLDFSWTPEQSAANWRKEFVENTSGGQRLFVAERDEKIVGFVWCQPMADTEGFQACIRGLYVLPTFQRRGVGRELVSHAVREFLELDLQSLEIGCVKENPSCDFYLHLGGVEIGTRPVRVDRYDTVEVIFGWRDMRVLVEERGSLQAT